MALAVALQTGLFVLLALGGAALVTGLFLKDAPMKQ
jgi:hypothetical protein